MLDGEQAACIRDSDWWTAAPMSQLLPRDDGRQIAPTRAAGGRPAVNNCESLFMSAPAATVSHPRPFQQRGSRASQPTTWAAALLATSGPNVRLQL